jgi:hypothetical protein
MDQDRNARLTSAPASAAEEVVLDPGHPAWEKARDLIVSRMLAINAMHPGNGCLKRDAERLREGQLAHMDVWIALDVLSRALLKDQEQ